jgi:excisionase family DNA binding protein
MLAAQGSPGSVTDMSELSTASPSTTLAQGPLLRPDEAAHLLSVKTSWVYEAVRSGRVPCVRVGRHIRFTRAMLEDWLAEQAESQGR